MSAPIKSDKHEVTWSNLAQDASTTQGIQLSFAVPSANKDASTEVEVGSHIKAFFLEFHFSANVITNPKVIHWIVIRKPGNLVLLSETPSLYYQRGRKFIIKRGMEMLPKDAGTVYKRLFVVRIPKVYQRQGDGDAFELRYVSTSAEAINACGICIYKEFY